MLELLLYTNMNCQDAEALMLRISRHESLPPIVKVELVETVKDSVPECFWDAKAD